MTQCLFLTMKMCVRVNGCFFPFELKSRLDNLGEKTILQGKSDSRYVAVLRRFVSTAVYVVRHDVHMFIHISHIL